MNNYVICLPIYWLIDIKYKFDVYVIKFHHISRFFFLAVKKVKWFGSGTNSQ